MLKYNNNHLFTGYLKNLLSTFNLPKYRIYTKDDERYFSIYGTESPTIIESVVDGINRQVDETTGVRVQSPVKHVRYVPYIKGHNLMEYISLDGETPRWIPAGRFEKAADGGVVWTKNFKHYLYNKPDLNDTKTLKITNNIYDSYTHEYFGDYLRFQRDYNNFDLMPLYNCFSNRVCSRYEKNLSIEYMEGATKKSVDIKLSANDKSSKIYMLPVKLFKEYTIAIESWTGAEMWCDVYGKYQDKREKFNDIAKHTYKKYNRLAFAKPVLYTGLKEISSFASKEHISDIANYEEDLKLFIKLPKTNSSSIVVLEGNYCGWNDHMFYPQGNSSAAQIIQNRAVVNFNRNDEIVVAEVEKHTETYNATTTIPVITRAQNFEFFKPITSLQLLRINTGVSYPFADRMIEYIMGNAITSEENLSDNIVRTQKVMLEHGTILKDLTLHNSIVAGPYAGLWTEAMQPAIYDYMTSHSETCNPKTIDPNINHDILGYVDKDTEVYYKWEEKRGNQVVKSDTIATTDIYPDLYLDNKKEK